jgi:hypothetical protein
MCRLFSSLQFSCCSYRDLKRIAYYDSVYLITFNSKSMVCVAIMTNMVIVLEITLSHLKRVILLFTHITVIQYTQYTNPYYLCKKYCFLTEIYYVDIILYSAIGVWIITVNRVRLTIKTGHTRLGRPLGFVTQSKLPAYISIVHNNFTHGP